MVEKITTLGIIRSGNHAICYWIKPQMVGEVKFLNNCQYFRKGNKNASEYNLIGFENVELSKYLERKQEWFNIIGGKCKTIVILRNPWNIVASHIKHSGKTFRSPKTIINRIPTIYPLWCDYYKHYINNTEDLTFIIYDKWFNDIDYRKSISLKLGLNFIDIGLNFVAEEGDGSSFDGRNFNGKAQNMDVLRRYENIDNKEMQDYMNSEIGLELKEKWNNLCDLEKINELKIK